MPVSVLILTLNEEENLPLCLDSLQWCDDIVVLDSYSSDTTKQVAEKSDVRVCERVFDNYASQRNFGINNIDYKYDWLLMVDADETVSEEVVAEIQLMLEKPGKETTLYRMRRKDYFLGKWIRRSSGYPTWFGRLVKIGFVTVERSINEEYMTNGGIGYLENHLNHYPFNKGLDAWIEKHNRYSTMEAALIVQRKLIKPALRDCISNDPALRRKTMKAILYRLPFRPLMVFLYLFIFRGGFLDGKAGFIFCSLRSWYEFMINCKIIEQKHTKYTSP